ncbi:MAG: tRNA threonylcarbamoyladenosine dehydratase [Bacteroides sp.]|nr:tRNA threonylcarbamoyladenosine dehydratase [Bacteroides sp.]
MEDFYSRTKALLGEAGTERLKNSRVAVFGLGGVGSYAAESVVRAGIGSAFLIDGDAVSESNINRQLYALRSTVGKDKTDAARERCLDINPDCDITAFKMTVTPENLSDIPLETCNYVIDAIDDVRAKKAIIARCRELNVPIISSMGTGNKLHPERLRIADIYDTSVCPLARVMRHDLRKLGIERLKVVFSDEPPVVSRTPPASVSFVPSAAGLMMGGEVIRELAGATDTR